MAALTLRCHILYANLVFVGHVTKHREDDKPWEETGDTVHRGGQESIPAEKRTLLLLPVKHWVKTEVTDKETP